MLVGLFVLTLAISGPTTLAEPPAAIFSWSYNETTDRVTVTMDSGEKMRATFVRFRGWTATPERPLPENLTWESAGGGTGGSYDSTPAITAGDSVTLPAADTYVVEIVFDTPHSEPMRLAIDSGPDRLGLSCWFATSCEPETKVS